MDNITRRALALLAFLALSHGAFAQQAFYADKARVDQTGFPSNVYHQVTFSTVRFDTCSCYNATTGLWTPVAGPVIMSVQVFIASGGVATGNPTYVVKIIKNGINTVAGDDNGNVAGVGPVGATPSAPATKVTAVDIANGADTYGVWLYATGNPTTTLDGNPAHTYFSGIALGTPP